LPRIAAIIGPVYPVHVWDAGAPRRPYWGLPL